MFKTIRIAVLLLALFAAADGCRRNPGYLDPPAPLTELAVLRGVDQTYIQVIDNAKVISGMSMHASGGNEVKVTGGTHRLRVYTMAKGMQRAAMQHEFTFDFKAGHRYQLSPAEDSVSALAVRDLTAGVTVNVN
ncbi:MAG TPA: hypothetical protein VGN72_22085 [Tepidisphaeraceae bacterium]|nr:hypothetical protein [Tepidisphaeraceae bacterium]